MDATANSPNKRAKCSGGEAAATDEKVNVYVWDMDETLILFKSLLDGTYAKAHDGMKDAQRGAEIGEMWENLILDLCDQHFFYDQVEDHNEPSLGSLSKFDDGCDLAKYSFEQDEFTSSVDDDKKRRLAYRYRTISSMYDKGLCDLFPKEKKEKWDELYELTDEYTDRWLSSARSFLQQCVSEKEDPDPRVDSSVETLGTCHVNVLVTSGALVPSIAKCMLYRFDSLIKHGDVYSALDVGKLQCFEWVRERFSGPNFRFCVIGDGWEECAAAKSMGWPFVQVNFQQGTCHKFPGLTLRTLGHYFSVVYDEHRPADEEA
ncbi:hypothetical protein MLD38_015514 [Melastoma candidum]|uniref:Uncharacterized protein n=1 Tax=Melastoma candidum TaxID=119954 RepID=A0ACB9RGH7_9MYRT|nr:hypothetical protein MLD38_015514 [Melastoma candidum]